VKRILVIFFGTPVYLVASLWDDLTPIYWPSMTARVDAFFDRVLGVDW